MATPQDILDFWFGTGPWTRERLEERNRFWFGGDRYTAIVPGPKKVNSVTVDPDSRYPDVRRENNRWPAGINQSETLTTPPARSATGR